MENAAEVWHFSLVGVGGVKKGATTGAIGSEVKQKLCMVVGQFLFVLLFDNVCRFLFTLLVNKYNFLSLSFLTLPFSF